MPEISIIIYDNGLHAQNQDYLPSRSLLQKEFITQLINRKFDDDMETLVGIIPVCQAQYNDILTPTKQKDYLYTFINNCGLNDNINYVRALAQSICAFQQREITTKNLFLFFGCAVNLQTSQELFTKILEMLTYGISVTVICFGDGLNSFDTLQEEIDLPHFKVVKVSPQDDYNDIYNMTTGATYEDDPELAEAIRMSIEESKKGSK